MPVISWNEASPADGDSAGLGDDAIRSLKTSVRVAIDAEHVFPSGGGDAGVHRLGAARTFYGPESGVSSSGTDGRLMVTSDTSRLFHVGSAGTMFLGDRGLLSMGSGPFDTAGTGIQRFYWANEVGQAQTVSGSTTLTFARSGFSSLPHVQLTQYGGGGFTPGAILQVQTLTATQATIVSYATGGGVINTLFFWEAVGTRAL